MTSVHPGDVLADKYRVERVLGSGGMGYVVAARHLQLDQLVAIKLLRKGAVEENEASARFFREAKAAGTLRSEHIAHVFDVGTLESGEPFMVMEYLEGTDLSALVKQRGQFAVAEACDYVIQACEALAEAHLHGIIHRDIKPANLFLTKGPTGAPLVKVLDFGISKKGFGAGLESDVTRTAAMLGSPRFMSPEQMRDPRAVDARTDIWALGVALYRFVAGRHPFEAETLAHLLAIVMHEEPPPLASLRADLPPGFDAVVARCLCKPPEGRFSSVAELTYALAPFTSAPTQAVAAAERMAAMLGTVSLPELSASRPSLGGDTGAPWIGVGERAAPPQGARSTVLAAIGLLTLLVGTPLVVKARHDAYMQRGTAHAAAAAAPVTNAVSAAVTSVTSIAPGIPVAPAAPSIASPALEPTAANPTAGDAPPAAALTAPAKATPAVAVTNAPGGPRKGRIEPSTGAISVGARPGTGPTAGRALRPAAGAGTKRADEGIPTTRD